MTKRTQTPNASARNRAPWKFTPQSRSELIWLWPRLWLLLVLIALGFPALTQQAVDKSQDPANSSIQGVVTVISPGGKSMPLEGVRLYGSKVLTILHRSYTINRAKDVVTRDPVSGQRTGGR